MMNAFTEDLINFLSQCAAAITDLSDSDIDKDHLYKTGALELSSSLLLAKEKDFTTQALPIIKLLDDVNQTPFTFNFDEIRHQLKWRPSPRTDSKGEVIALSTINDMLQLKGVLLGLMFMSPHQVYPEHRHSPQELYLVLSGTASWLYGGNDKYQTQKSGDIIYNQPHDLHGMKTANEPLLALYILWGDELESYSY